jgi:histidyl-tRNA synthetase
VFEWVADGSTICGGGRYDPLIEMLGGKPAPACGFALGVERVLELMRAQEAALDRSQCDVYVVHSGEGSASIALQLAERIRDRGVDVLLHCGGGSFKSQFKRADSSGASLAVVVGDEEIQAGEASVKWLRSEDSARAQQRVSQAQLAEFVVDALIGNQSDAQ